MPEMKLVVNGSEHTLDAELDTPLLWVLRDGLGLTGTKFGCGIGVCGSCTVHLDGQPVQQDHLRQPDQGQRDAPDPRPVQAAGHL